MPFRPGIISSGEDYVGETAALNRKLRKTKGARVPSLYHFDSEEELFDTEGRIVQAQESDDNIIGQRRLYQQYWGAVKREWAYNHQPWECRSACIPTDRREFSCGGCDHGPFHCLCNDGKKWLSHSRIVFWNSAIAWSYRNLVYVIGAGVYVPRANPEPAPDWRSLDWKV